MKGGRGAEHELDAGHTSLYMDMAISGRRIARIHVNPTCSNISSSTRITAATAEIPIPVLDVV